MFWGAGKDGQQQGDRGSGVSAEDPKKKVGVKIHDKGFYELGGVIYTNDDFTDDKIHRVQESSSQKSTTPFLHSLLFTALARGWSRAPEPLRSLTKCS